MANPPLSADAYARLMALQGQMSKMQAEMASIFSGETGGGGAAVAPPVAAEQQNSETNATALTAAAAAAASETTMMVVDTDTNAATFHNHTNLRTIDRDVLVRAFNFLPFQEVVSNRLVSNKWQATTRLACPHVKVYFGGDEAEDIILQLTSLRWALPKITSLEICGGDLPDGCIKPISGFLRLRSLTLSEVGLKDDAWFLKLSNLQELTIYFNMAWDLSELSALTHLKKLACVDNESLTGSLKSLGFLKEQLSELNLSGCSSIKGSLKDLWNFSVLRELKLSGTNVVAACEISANKFPSLYEIDDLVLEAVACAVEENRSTVGLPSAFALRSVIILDLESGNCNLDWDAGVVASLPNLQQLRCGYSSGVTGDLDRLRPLKNSLTDLDLEVCSKITGCLSSLKDFPFLKSLNLDGTKVVADVEKVGPDDFPSLVYFDRIGSPWRVDDAPAYMKFIFERSSRAGSGLETITDEVSYRLHVKSPDYYKIGKITVKDTRLIKPPFDLEFVNIAGQRTGWRWCSGVYSGTYCETHWLEPGPSPNENDYDKYRKQLEKETKQNLGPFEGRFRPPPTKEEYIDVASAYISYPLAFTRNVRPRIE